jgi:hypothetical protein
MAILRGRADPKAPGPCGAIVRMPRRDRYKIAQGGEPNEWLLLTSLSLTNTEELLDVVRTCSQRWTIEIFLACLYAREILDKGSGLLDMPLGNLLSATP